MPSDYWRKRQESLQKTLLQGADDYTEEIERGYRAAVEETEKQIAMWYQRFADNNGVDLIAAQRLLNGDELKELKWDVKQYIKHAEENGIAADWSKELENASARVHISRLEALKMQIREQIEEMCGGRAEKVRELIGDIYTESLYRNGYEHYMRTGTETTFARVDKQRLNRILDKPWTADGYNFSERLWGNKRKLIKTVNTELTSAIARGEAPTKTAERIARAMKNDKAAAQRLVVTEGAYFATQGQRDCYKELEVEEFEVVGTLDNITCTECGSMDGKHFKVKDMQEGVTAPPFHPNCRCTTVPYYPDDYGVLGTRTARDEDGKNVEVNGKLKYPEWKERILKNGVENDGESGIIKSIDVDDFNDMAETHQISEEVSNLIANVIKQYEDKGGMYISEAHFGDFYDAETGKRALFQVFPNKYGLIDINVNSAIMGGKTVGEIDEMVANTHYNLPNNLVEAVVHECGHAKAYYQKTAEQIQAMNNELKNAGVKGISKIAEDDGAECIAEVEVLLYRGEKVPSKAMELYNKFVKGK